jgi:molybdenum cofactor cytidylyltransferase
MGSPKALLDAGGPTFLARILSSFRDGGAHPLYVVVGDTESEIAAEGRRHGAMVVLNPDPSTGPVSSLQAGLGALPNEAPGALFTPVDHPFISAATVRRLIQAFREKAAPVVVPTFRSRRGHPVLFSRSLFPELTEPDLPEGARTVVHRYLASLLQIPVEDPGILADIDTPEEYRKHFP